MPPEITKKSRDHSGRWRAGTSGNPGGRPPDLHRIGALARQHAPRALEVLVELLDNEDPNTRMRAAHAILNRAVGRPADALELAQARAAIERRSAPLTIKPVAATAEETL